jgi:bifunctional DNA-binding transcriptional regulator/antitoxin component of YhaV-PrlF toxin-antitoxin module
VLLRPKRQMTIPKGPCEDAGLKAGERLRAHADGPGRILLKRIDLEEDQATGEQAPA